MTETTTPSVDISNDPFETKFSEVELICPKCTAMWSPPVAVTVNGRTDPEAKEGVLRGTMHRARCPRCKEHEYNIDQIWDYFDPDQNLIIQFRPKWEYKAGGEEEVYFARLETLVMKYADHDVKVDVAFGFEDAIAKHLGGEEAVAQAMARAEREREEGREYGSIVKEEAIARMAKEQAQGTA